MTKDIVSVDPVTSTSPTKEPRKPHVDSGKPLDSSPEHDQLSEEDKQLKDELELLVVRLQDSNHALYRPALESLRTLIRSSTSSMTSVPKPLKFLRPHYPTLVASYSLWPDSEDKRFLADILSVLAMTYADEGDRDSIKYRLLGSQDDVGSWGHEYVRHLASEIGLEYNARIAAEPALPTTDLLTLADQITPFFLKHNAEADAVDLLLEIEVIDHIVPHVDINTVARVGLYMVSCVPYLPYPEDETVLRAAHSIYRKVNQLPEAMALAIRLDDKDLIQNDFDASKTDPALCKQLAFLLARHGISGIQTDDEVEQQILSNAKLTEYFIVLARELGITEPKTPDDIYKTHLETRSSAMTMDSAKQNLASSLVNAFVNCGFAADKLMLVDDPQWIYKNKDRGMLTATASLGLLLLWDVQAGLTHIDKYLYSTDANIKAGALLAIGLVSANVRDENDPAMALLSEHLSDTSDLHARLSAITGLGIAYAGSSRSEVGELILPLVTDNGEISCHAALALGLIFAGTCDGELTSHILQVLMEYSGKACASYKLIGLGLALLYLGKQEACEPTLETLKAIDSPLSKAFQVLVETCAYAGTGNVLKVQEMTRLCSEAMSADPKSKRPETSDSDKENDEVESESVDSVMEAQALAVIGIALIAMGEDIGAEMALRTYNHLMHYGTPSIRKAVPLAIALQCASNPVVSILDTLSKLSHDHDMEVAVNAIFAMGMVGAGTNNARLAQMLRQLASYYNKDPNCLFMVRVAQGLVHMGKGTVTINPYHTNRSLLSRVALGGILAVLVSMTDAKSTILDKTHWLMYHLVGAMYPRILLTMDEALTFQSISVRVGQAVDVVGQAGRPKTITGFQTHNTPVLMAYGERAELATEEFITLTPVVEGFVIVKKNPEYMEEDKE